jgi:NAD(P)-dependent dehydrogenase (short-subunit alcohol dehydrogenase family)
VSPDGRVVAVTGAASGIGFETARQLAASGAHVALLDIDLSALAIAERTIPHADGQLMRLAVDTAETSQMESAVQAITARFGRLDGLVANAGVRMRSTLVTELEDDVWDRLMRVNLRGVFVACRAGARPMIAAKAGAMVAVASLSGHAPRIGQSAYCASKAGVIQLARTLALELSEHRVRVNAVCPGTVNTAILKQAQAQDGPQVLHERIYGNAARFRPGIPLRQIAEPEDVAATIVFLLSPAARHITGQTIFVDGGESIV